MKKYFAGAIVVVAAIGIGWLWRGKYFAPQDPAPVAPVVEQEQSSQAAPVVSSMQTNDDVQAPLDRAGERVTKKPFGIFITPQTSPVQPEKFRGYHTGADFEIFPDELNADVPVRAICAGKIVVKKSASGYGGVLTQDCVIDGQAVTVVYGHLKLASIVKKVGDNLEAGESLGILGADKSVETAGERKHLHLGIHKGSAINILGYVSAKNELSGWLDPCTYVCR